MGELPVQESENKQDGIHTPKPQMEHIEYKKIKSDAEKFPDEASLKTYDTAEIYPKLIAFDRATSDYRLQINWKK